ncbi:MAG: lysophospholipid acyltransferase family protein [Verrucomicrobiota bacterium]
MDDIAQPAEKASQPKRVVQPRELAFHQKVVLRVLAGFVGLWSRTLRFKWAEDVQSLMDSGFPPCVVIFWHNRLFIAPEFYRRHFSERKLAVLVSPSKDGAWSEGFTKLLGILPIRGSRKGGRAAQAVRDLIAAGKAGRDISFTPDGSRGPMYDMKAGAVTVAMKTGAPILLLSFNCEKSWRLKSWDRLFLPKPFSQVGVQMDYVGYSSQIESRDAKIVAGQLKVRLDAMNDDL